MRLVVQRVSSAAVRVEGRTVSRIGRGLLILTGVGVDDDEAEAEWLARKVSLLRIFEDDQGKMNLDLREVAGEALVVPQFTLYGDARRGRRPSWAKAAPASVAEHEVERFSRAMEGMGISVKRGAFRAHMSVELVNDGPVTILLEGRVSETHC